MSYDTDLQLFIDGVWKNGEGRDAHTVINPVTGSGIAEVPYATKSDLEEAFMSFARPGEPGAAGRAATARKSAETVVVERSH